MDAMTRGFVRQRAGDRCEYCHLHQDHSALSHHLEHIRAKQRCNLHKGTNLTGIDPKTGHLAPIFHPRRDRWSDHFVFEGVRIIGLSAVGRATIRVLNMNDARRLELRTEVLKRGELT